jgi:hypothetical protein
MVQIVFKTSVQQTKKKMKGPTPIHIFLKTF